LNIFLTGGASGLGLEIFQRLSRAGHDVAFTYNGSAEQAEKNLNDFPKSKKYHCNFNDPKSVEDLVKILGDLEVDVLIHNALPLMNAIQFQKTRIDSLVESFNCSVIPVLKISQICISNFRKKKSGRIIAILTSYLINKPPIGYSEYVANKAYIHSMAKSWANENSKFGIIVNSISPSIMRTPLNQKVDDRLLENLEASNPLGQLLTISELGELVEFLVDSPRQLTGCNFLMNGGENVI
jgi:NAD(P)-dependent dehydrogenase (short-subunit alcohol dehydrogenase family)